MNNPTKLIAELQRRIAHRRPAIAELWKVYHEAADRDEQLIPYCTAICYGQDQKFDKQLLKLVQSPFDTGFAVGYQEACKAVKLTLEACECQN